MAPKKKSDEKSKDSGNKAGKGKGKGKGDPEEQESKVKGAHSINVRHILVSRAQIPMLANIPGVL